MIASSVRTRLGRLAFGATMLMLIGASLLPSALSVEASSAPATTTLVIAPTRTPTPQLGLTVERQPGIVKQG